MEERKLSDDLRYWRAERPDEWTMDEFIRKAEKLERATIHNSGYSKLPLGYEASADKLATEVSKLVRDGVIGSRTPAADALLEYKDGNFA